MISVIILVAYRYDTVYKSDGSIAIAPDLDDDLDLTIMLLGYLQLATSLTLLMGWIVNKANILVKAGWR